jgi:hypothetical protein
MSGRIANAALAELDQIEAAMRLRLHRIESKK